MLDRTSVLIVVAAATIVAPILFVGVLAVAGRRRSIGAPVGPRLTALVTALGGISLGLLLLMSGSLIVAWPILAAVVVLGIVLLRRGRLREAGWLLAGAAAPWTVLWAVFLAALYLRLNAFDYWQTWLGFLIGAVPMLFGLIVALARRLPGPPAAARPADGRRDRSLYDIGTAIRAPAVVGAFGIPEVAMLVALVGTWVVAGLLMPATIPEPVRLAILVVLGSVLGTEAYIRAMPAPARWAFEAFSWLGEHELAQARAQTGEAVPTNPRAARQWLLAHPEQPDQRWLRVGILVLAGRIDEAQAVAGRMPASTPEERFARAAESDFADWFGGGEGDLAALESAARDLASAGEDARLRAEVTIAAARCRRLVASGGDPVAAGAPLRDVRRRLGSRADGQLGRALRGRVQRSLLLVGAGFAVLTLAFDYLLPAA